MRKFYSAKNKCENFTQLNFFEIIPFLNFVALRKKLTLMKLFHLLNQQFSVNL